MSGRETAHGPAKTQLRVPLSSCGRIMVESRRQALGDRQGPLCRIAEYSEPALLGKRNEAGEVRMRTMGLALHVWAT
jgi:hypothetical protein